MATRIEDRNGSRIVGSHVPFGVALAVIPQLSRPLLALVIDRAIEHLNGLEGDADLEPTGDDEPEEDCCEARDDDFTRIGDDGLPGDPDDTEPNGDEGDYTDGDRFGIFPNYGVDQSKGPTGAQGFQ